MTTTARQSRTGVVVGTLVLGAGVLWWSLGIQTGRPLFYLATVLLAVVWAGGARAAGPFAWVDPRRTPSQLVVPSLVLGVGLLVVFILGATVVARIPVLAAPVDDLLEHARRGSLALVLLITIINGVAEELFFRGALFAAMPQRWAIPATTIVYALSTIGSGVPLLVFAAVVLGVVTALQRRATGGVLAPAIVHVTWSTGMLLVLPPVLDSLR